MIGSVRVNNHDTASAIPVAAMKRPVAIKIGPPSPASAGNFCASHSPRVLAKKKISNGPSSNANFSNGVTISGGTITVPAGVTSFTVTVAGVQDTLDEAAETVPLSVGGMTGTGTITDDDATPSLSIANVTVNEAAGTASFTVTLSAASGQDVSVSYGTSNGTATAGSDYTTAGGTLTFLAGEITKTITVAITDDTVFEGATGETFNVVLSGASNATITTGTGTGTITDNDGAPTITGVSSPTAAEGNDLVYTVTLSNPSSTATTA